MGGGRWGALLLLSGALISGKAIAAPRWADGGTVTLVPERSVAGDGFIGTERLRPLPRWEWIAVVRPLPDFPLVAFGPAKLGAGTVAWFQADPSDFWERDGVLVARRQAAGGLILTRGIPFRLDLGLGALWSRMASLDLVMGAASLAAPF